MPTIQFVLELDRDPRARRPGIAWDAQLWAGDLYDHSLFGIIGTSF